MAFKLTKAEQKDLDREIEKVFSERHDLDAAAAEFNDIIGPALEKLKGAIQSYNQAKADLGSTIRDIHSRLEQEYSEKTERWQDSDRGSEVMEWINRWEPIADYVETEIEEPDISEIEFDEPDYGEYIESEIEYEPEFTS